VNSPQDASPTGTGRWIRPAAEAQAPGRARAASPRDIDELSGRLVAETRRRVSGLVALERELEDKIRARWEESEATLERKLAQAEEEAQAVRRRLEGELKDARSRAEKEGRTVGFREGFARGRDEGYRLGFEEGRREGQREGREEEAGRVRGELSGGAAALVKAAREIEERREAIFEEARRELLALAMEIARKVLKRELRIAPESILLNVVKAVDLVFRRGTLAVHVHPLDAPIVAKALAAEPRWAEGFEAIEVRSSSDVSRGGCRLVSGAGAVDMTVDTQLSLIQAALDGAGLDPGCEDLSSTPSAAATPDVAGQVPERAEIPMDGGAS
jgi:flagellar assembly protein FliH